MHLVVLRSPRFRRAHRSSCQTDTTGMLEKEMDLGQAPGRSITRKMAPMEEPVAANDRSTSSSMPL